MVSVSVMIAVGSHLFPFRTEKLKPPAPKILEEISGKIGRRRDSNHNTNLVVSLKFILPIFTFIEPRLPRPCL